MINIIKKGHDMTKQPQYQVTCYKCKCEFTFDKSEFQSDLRNEIYIQCPNPTCNAFIDHSVPKMIYNPFNER